MGQHLNVGTHIKLIERREKTHFCLLQAATVICSSRIKYRNGLQVYIIAMKRKEEEKKIPENVNE